LPILESEENAMATAVLERRTEKLDFRISETAKEKLQLAASVSHRTMSDFVLESALSKAEEMLADRRTFGLNDEAWEALQDALDAPARPLPKLKALLNKPGFFGDMSAR
jgi:uncharacterized protein (DUF1778 family)